MRDAFHALAAETGVTVDFPLALEIEHHVAGTTASLLFWLRLPDRPPAETYLSALHSIDSAAAERLLAKLRK